MALRTERSKLASDSLKCPEPCCGKKFKYPSLLHAHMENVHIHMECVYTDPLQEKSFNRNSIVLGFLCTSFILSIISANL